MGSFFTKISDPLIGGTYMTLVLLLRIGEGLLGKSDNASHAQLNTLSNLGGTWPRFFVLEAVDYFSDTHCTAKEDGVSVPQSCLTDAQKTQCQSLGGDCVIDRDGYYIVGMISFVVGLLTLLFYIKPMVKRLQVVPDRAWRLKKEKDEGEVNGEQERFLQ